LSGARRRDHVAPVLHNCYQCECDSELLVRLPSLFGSASTASPQHIIQELCVPVDSVQKIVDGHVCIDWLHPATTGADINRTEELRCLCAVSVEQSAAVPPALRDEHLQAEAEHSSVPTMTNITRRRCRVFFVISDAVIQVF